MNRLLKALCHDDKRRSHLGGFYKGVQAAGGAVAFRLNIKGVLPVSELTANWVLLTSGIFFAAPMVFRNVRKDENNSARQEDSDATV